MRVTLKHYEDVIGSFKADCKLSADGVEISMNNAQMKEFIDLIKDDARRSLFKVVFTADDFPDIDKELDQSPEEGSQ